MIESSEILKYFVMPLFATTGVLLFLASIATWFDIEKVEYVLYKFSLMSFFFLLLSMFAFCVNCIKCLYF